MKSKFLPSVTAEVLQNAKAGGDQALYDLLVQPLHEELFRRQTFDFLDDLSGGQQLLLSYEYVRMQVGQGGFIQFIQNGYIALLPDIIEMLNKIGAPEMAKVMDDALKVFVLNKDVLSRNTTIEEFALLYQELKEFEEIDKRFELYNAPTITKILLYVNDNENDFYKNHSLSDY